MEDIKTALDRENDRMKAKKLKPLYIVTTHWNDRGEEYATVLSSLLYDFFYEAETFTSLAKAKKRMKADIREFKKSYKGNAMVFDITDRVVKVKMRMPSPLGEQDMCVGEWRILEI